MTRCGYVTLLGSPNVGKSTLLNYVVGQKLAIISPKPQTTRTRLRGIVMHNDAQMIFVDTPGVFAPRHGLDKNMVSEAWAGMADADLVLFIVDATKKQPDPSTFAILGDIKKHKGHKPVWLVLNKVDALARKEQLLENSAAIQGEYTFEKTFMISAKGGDGVQELLKESAAVLPEGPYLYDPEEVTDTPQRVLAAELTREQVFLQLEQELPYSIAVQTDKWESFENGSAKVWQTIYVQRDGQKGIVIGAKGSRLKAIGEAARRQMREAFGFDVHLMLHVKVKENWQERAEFY